MALPLLVSGTECGSSNPLQGLSKQFDQDRSLQEDHFRASRAGVSGELFRTQGSGSMVTDQEAAHFFSSNSSASQLVTSTVYDLSTLHRALPLSHIEDFTRPQQLKHRSPIATWASDFIQQEPIQTSLLHSMNLSAKTDFHVQSDATTPTLEHISTAGVQTGRLLRGSTLSGCRMSPMTSPAFSIPMRAKYIAEPDQLLWDQEFHAQQIPLASSPSVSLLEAQERQQPLQQLTEDADDLARTAGLLLDTVKDDQNPKFQNSEFMSLMKQLRDRAIIVKENEMVENDGNNSSITDWADSETNIKGKKKAIDAQGANAKQMRTTETRRDLGQNNEATLWDSAESIAVPSFIMATPRENYMLPKMQNPAMEEADANDTYFLQENEDYIQWNHLYAETASERMIANPGDSWGQLQSHWDEFEAASTGIKSIINYQFQANNPYLRGESSRTRQRERHSNGILSSYESVLELEAAVQRDMTDAGAWFELGVKQQENEREQKAIQALQRAIELDPSHLAAWLALAVSHTNDGNRLDTYNAVGEWINRNGKYKAAVRRYRAQTPENPSTSTTERFGHLIQCLITMARNDINGEVDADIQVALAVLLNANEDYEKAQDCFRSALAVRPDDWLLYNRVGATMANSGHAGEALQYYYRALELNPNYIRARFNLGISCINLRRYEEAARHILDALALQDADGIGDLDAVKEKHGVTSTALWDSLKMACLLMERVDLASHCDHRDLDGFRNNFQT